MIRVTQHAIDRYRERVDDIAPDVAEAILSSDAISRAADFGAPFVKLGTGQHVVLDGHTVVTVLPRETWPQSMDRRKIRDLPLRRRKNSEIGH